MMKDNLLKKVGAFDEGSLFFRIGARINLLIFCACLCACATVSPVMNQPISSTSEHINTAVFSPDDSTLLILTFSGGGVRAAALSYGVLKGLRDIQLQRRKANTLLDEVDIISSVSGGSFTAAYYGLFGRGIFEDYEKDFLKRRVESEVIRNWLLSPANWNKLGSPEFNRTDLVAEYYDEHIFDNRTFANMRTDMPVIIINTTDISTGTLFAFTPDNMQWICSDLRSYPVSRAVAASAAVPGVFSPITLENHSGCPVDIKKTNNVEVIKLQDKSRYPYLHLVDGGIVDNLGIRSLLRIAEIEHNDLSAMLKKYQLKGIKQVAFIVVDAADEILPRIAQTPQEPSAADTINAVATIRSKRYNADTMRLLKAQIERWKKQPASRYCHKKKGCRPIDFHLIYLELQELPKLLADEVSLYKTALELPEQQVDTLIKAGRYLLLHNKDFRHLLKSMSVE